MNRAGLHVLFATILCLVLSLLYIRHVGPAYPESAFDRQDLGHVPGVRGRVAIYDEADYLIGAKNIAEGHGYSLDGKRPTAKRQPLYSLYLAAFFRLFGPSVDSAMLANACALALLPLLAFFITSALFDQRAAILAAYLCVLDPALYFFGVGEAYAEALFAVFLCGAMALWLHARKEEFSHTVLASAAAGLLFGAVALTRSGYLAFPLLLCLTEIWSRRWRNVRSALVLCAAALICVIPWVVRNEVRLGSPVVSCLNDGVTLWGSELAALDGHGDWVSPTKVSSANARIQEMPDEIARNQQAQALALETLKKIPPVRLVKVLVLRVVRFWVPYTRLMKDERGFRLNIVLTLLLSPAMFLGLVTLIHVVRDRRHLYSAAPMLLAVVYATALSAASWGSTRFRMPLEPMLIGFSASGLVWAWTRAVARIRGQPTEQRLAA
jgi:4-amino-4-deoxy-L-arabinose transferase-like glycosyltransferase